MLHMYLEEVTKMLFADMRQLDIGYACSFAYNWSVSGGAESKQGVDRILDIRPTKEQSAFSDRPSLVAALGKAYEKARNRYFDWAPQLARFRFTDGKLQNKTNMHWTLAGEWRQNPPIPFLSSVSCCQTMSASTKKSRNGGGGMCVI